MKLSMVKICFIAFGAAMAPIVLGQSLGSSNGNAGLGTAKFSAYECSGMTGVALALCMELNRANSGSSTNGETISPTAPSDCTGMTGTALRTCQELNGTRPASSAGSTAGIAPYAGPNTEINYGNAGVPGNGTNNGMSVENGVSALPNNGLSPGSGVGGSSAGTNNGLSGGSGVGGSSAGSNNGLSGGSGIGVSSAGTNNGLSGGSGVGGSSAGSIGGGRP